MSVEVRREDTITVSLGFTADSQETAEFGRLIKEAADDGYSIDSVTPIVANLDVRLYPFPDGRPIGLRVVLSR